MPLTSAFTRIARRPSSGSGSSCNRSERGPSSRSARATRSLLPLFAFRSGEPNPLLTRTQAEEGLFRVPIRRKCSTCRVTADKVATNMSIDLGSPGGVLRLIREGRALTRTDVMDVTGLSRSTVMQRLGVLLSAQLLLEQPEAGPSSGGGRAAALTFNQHMGVVLAADLGARHGRLAVCDLAGVALAEREEAIRIADGAEQVLGWLEHTFEALLTEAGHVPGDVLGTAIGVPGPVEVATGRPVNPPIMPGWDGYPVAERLAARFGAPALLERDV